jgi:hypothetical protein
VLAASTEPLTLSKIRSRLPAPFRSLSLEELTEALQRQVAANVVVQYPKYRSQQDRYWDRSMQVHVAALLRETLEAGPLALAELRRKLPAYALAHTETVLQEQVNQGLLHRHPRSGKRGGDRYGVRPPDVKEYLQPELSQVFQRLENLGFSRTQIRAEALQLLHDEEWSPSPPAPPAEPAAALEGACPPITPAPEAAACTLAQQPESRPAPPETGSLSS